MTKLITKGVWNYVLGVFLTVSSLSATVQAQSVTIVPNGPIVCAGTQLNAVVTGLSAPITYQWSNGVTASSIFVNNTGFYRVSVRGFVNGSQVLVRSAWTPLLVIPNTNATINPTGPVNVCPGQTATLFGGGGQFFSSYLWSNGQTSRNITVNQTGDYTLSVSNNFGSCSTSSNATVHVEVFDAGYQPAITALSPITVCKPGFVNLTGDPGFSSYSWSNGASTQNVSILMDGLQLGAVLDTLTVTLTVGLNGGACSFSSAGIVLRSVRQTELNSNYCGNFNLTTADSVKAEVVLTYITAPEYEFEFEETTNPGVVSTVVSSSRWCALSSISPAVQANKFYNVRVRPVIGGQPFCWGNSCQIGVVATPVNHNGNANRIGSSLVSNVFPNPSAAAFRMVLQGVNADENVDVRVTDMTGRLVDSFSYDTQAGSSQFGESLSDGVYLVTVQQGDNINTTRIVKTH